ncbi:TonB-dependent receptor domain-containing protein [Wenzhouxiangella marina]|uniref:Hemin receptor n=1 Tax=Wenzhouxiangella marina TaxID=1579979 RepID=A0A0K0XXL4_9GAMM|nr:TonB-dependent receptor [Wenzhouxiangella marina]AKS42351.1 Hemin receptor [Wenzhouxiangella marina]MBB6085876.1 hemoglobin/transferrin/lactoferrin receptor protein [Wenzhouxiangella marina]
MRKKTRIHSSLAPAVLLALTTAPLAASTESETDMSSPTASGLFRLDTLVVSATRTERAAFTTPASISRVEPEQIRAQQSASYQEIFEAIPGVGVIGGPRRIAEEPTIRGFADEQVAIRIDGARQNYNKAHGGRFLLDPTLIESIEVLRGAGSALYGSGALGGAFVIETATGRSRMAGLEGTGLRLGGGHDRNGDQRDARLMAYGLQGRFDWLAALTRREAHEDLVDGDGDALLATRDRIDSGLFKIGFEPDALRRIELSHERFDNEGLNPTNANAQATASNLVDRHTERRQTRLSYEHEDPTLRWLDLRATAYRNEVEAIESRLDDGRVDFTDFTTEGLDLVNTTHLGERAGEPLRLTLGAEAYRDRQSGRRDGLDRPQFPDADVEYQAAFAQFELGLGAGVSLIPGLRHDRFRYHSEQGLSSRDESRTTPRLALGWRPDESIYLWAEAAEAFRAPSLTELYADGVHFIAPLAPGQVVINEFRPTPDLKPEHSRQLQLGARWARENLWNRDIELLLEVTAHRSRVDDYVDQVVVFISGEPSFDPITQTLIFPGFTTNRNVDARIQGGELSAELRHDRGYLRLNLTQLDGERRNGEALASLQPDRAVLSMGLNLFDRQLRLGGELLLSRARTDVPEGALATPGYGKTDLHLAWLPAAGALEGFEFRLALDNVFDKAYRIHPNGIDQPGRSVRLSIAREFQWLN